MQFYLAETNVFSSSTLFACFPKSICAGCTKNRNTFAKQFSSHGAVAEIDWFRGLSRFCRVKLVVKNVPIRVMRLKRSTRKSQLHFIIKKWGTSKVLLDLMAIYYIRHAKCSISKLLLLSQLNTCCDFCLRALGSLNLRADSFLAYSFLYLYKLRNLICSAQLNGLWNTVRLIA